MTDFDPSQWANRAGGTIGGDFDPSQWANRAGGTIGGEKAMRAMLEWQPKAERSDV